MEQLTGIIHRVTYHNPDNGWSVLQVNPVGRLHEQVTVTVHQANVFAGATMLFEGEWAQHPKYGDQFKATSAIEQKPATSSALEKYLGSGLIYGVGKEYARRIVKHFGKDTLDVFENNLDRLLEVPGIAKGKLKQITESWMEHREIRNVMLFLQEYGVSTLFAVKIFKTYGNDAIRIVSDNPYQLSKDIYGIGFFSADKIALSMGLAVDSPKRIRAGIAHVLAAAREQGHCYLELEHIVEEVGELLKADYQSIVLQELKGMETESELKTRTKLLDGVTVKCFYSKSLYYDEQITASLVKHFCTRNVQVDAQRLNSWLQRFNEQQQYPLSDEQMAAVRGIVGKAFSILTGGPGCGKTTTTKTLVRLLLAMQKKVLLAAPTGRAAQRMSEVIGREAQTIHRLLVWNPLNGQFKKNKEEPLEADFVIIDECSMLDISISSSLLQAIPPGAQVLFIGDPNQLPSVGAGNVLKDLLDSGAVPAFHLTQVFRQAGESQIIQAAHQIIKRQVPAIESPIHHTGVWETATDCLFIDSEEATKDQLQFIKKVNQTMRYVVDDEGMAFVREKSADGLSDAYKQVLQENDYYVEDIDESEIEQMQQSGRKAYVFNVPTEYLHANITALMQSETHAEALRNVIKDIHPWSTLHHGFIASETIVRLYQKTIPEKMGRQAEIQILTPMTLGSIGSRNLNALVQAAVNPEAEGKPQLQVGDRFFRVGDRVIQRRNNYDLEVFNGDIGTVSGLNYQEGMLEVSFHGSGELRPVVYKKQEVLDLDHAYAITIHKSQGSEFDVVIIPVLFQHYNMLYQNLIYTALTRAKKTAILIGTRKAFALAVKNIDNRSRRTMLKELVGS